MKRNIALFLITLVSAISLNAKTLKHINRLEDNIGATKIHFTDEELASIHRHLESFTVEGARYPKEQEALTGK